MPPHFHFGMSEKAQVFTWKEQKILLREFVRYYSRHKLLLGMTLPAAVISPVSGSMIPVVILKVLENYLPDGNSFMVLMCMAAVVLLLFAGMAGDYVSMRWGAILGFRIESDMRNDLFRHLQTLSFSFYDREKSGGLLSRMTNDLTSVSMLAHRAPEVVITSTLRFLLGFTIMMMINWRLALFAVLPAPFILLWLRFFQGRMRRSFGEVRKAIGELNAETDNCIKGIRETRSFGNEKERQRNFEEKNSALLHSQEFLRRLMALFHTGMRSMLHGYTRIFIAVGVILVMFKMADINELIVFFMYSHSITMPMMMLVELVEQYQQGMAAFERFREIMQTPPEICDRPGCIKTTDVPLQGKLDLRDVRFAYGENAPEVIKGVTMEIAPGSKIALVGESGAGKSTLGALIPRFYEISSGTVLLDGRDIKDYSLELLRKSIGVVSQMPYIFDCSIKDNIAVGKAGASMDEITAAAGFAGIDDFVNSLPEKYETRCGENGVRLSGGQRQRIAIARVFLKNPPVLILDEATSALDNESEKLVQQAFDRLGKNRTCIVIAHRLSTIRDADRIYCMKDGIIVEEGNHDDLMAVRGYYHKLNTARSKEDIWKN